jgi:hypothetical protein
MNSLTNAVALGLASVASAQSYSITFNLSAPIDHVFVSADEWNGAVYAWDLFPITLGPVPAGRTTFSLGSHNVAAWAVFGTWGAAGMATGINSSINPPDGRTFDSVFPTYPIALVRSNTATLWNGAYNTQQAYYLFDFVLTNEDTLKTDLSTGSLAVYTFDTGASIGTATLSLGVPCYANCDNSTNTPALNVLDFSCFLNRFAAADPYANCDNSTNPPVLNVLDFSCFLNKFAAGCS